MKKAFLIILIFSMLHILSGEIATSISQQDNDWIINFSNTSTIVYEAMVISADPDYRSTSGSIILPPGESLNLTIAFRGEGQPSTEPVYIRLISDHPENPEIISLGAEKAQETQVLTNGEGPAIEYFYTPDCSRCREFLALEIPQIEKDLGFSINLQRYDVTTASGLKKMNSRLEALNSREKRLPLIIGGETILAGDDQIEKELANLVTEIKNNPQAPVTETTEFTDKKMSIPGLLPILLAGLLDGINPCAFSTLIFLLSWLGLAGRSRREILITGIVFTTSVFVTYYLIGLGAFTIVRESGSFFRISQLLKYTMAGILLILAVIHILDYIKIRMGKTSEISLQLSKKRKRKIHSIIRENTRKAGLFTGSIVLGILVTFYELGCTGQVYLPTLMYMVRIEKQTSAFFLLGIYNFAFVLPLIAVFAAAWKGLGSQKLADWFTGNLAGVKILSALFFLLMAGLLLIF